MTSKELKQQIEIEKFLKSLKKTWLRNGEEITDNNVLWSLNSNGTVDIEGRIDIFRYPSAKLPVKFGTINGGFYISNGNITTMENFPDIVNGNFSCFIDGLNSLNGLPKIITGDMFCQSNTGIFNEKDIRKVCKVGGTVNIQDF